ncbi:MAG: SDR family oxidoreductase [Candidatus Subteraquimicrobiales bacterium]|nr:SDR family oxidoreductase [Candidatus Subteraquimicrobiales bacterium]
MNLNEKIAVITGAGSGIGASVAEKLFNLNAKVALVAKSDKNVKNVTEKLDSSFKNANYHVCDVRNENSLIEVRDKILEKWKKIDILVTCAAAPAASGNTEELSFENWKKVLDTDLDGVFLSNKIFGSSMIKNRYGRIVNMTSFHTIATYPYRAAYNAAKSGVEGLTRALAVEWGKYGITVNAVAPGPIKTPRTLWFLSQNPDNEAGMIGRTPTARIGETEDVAALIAFLVSDEAKHINGQNIVIDGGWTKNAWWGTHVREY